jgi:hypothetical protein
MIFAGFLGEQTTPTTPSAAPVAVPAPAAPVVPTAPPVVPAATAANLVTPSAATRNPFTRPVQATHKFVPSSLHTAFIPEFQPFPTVMLPMLPRSTRLPAGVHQPMAAEPQPGGAPTMGGFFGADAPGALPADPSGQSSVPPSIPSPVKMSGGRMMPPGLIMALGIMPQIRGVRTRHVNPSALVSGGRKVGLP